MSAEASDRGALPEAAVSPEAAGLHQDAHHRPLRGAGLVLGCFLLSGMGGLIFEVVWSRLLALVFGATSFAIATVLAAYMGGMALGAVGAARFAPRVQRPLRVYALLEVLVAGWGFCLPWLLRALPDLQRALWSGLGADSALFPVARLVLALVLLLPPTAAMGATLPLLARFLARRGSVGTRVGTLYSVNTFGAVLGAGLAGFVLLPLLGAWTTNLVAALLDLAAAGAMLLWARGVETQSEARGARRRAAKPSSGEAEDDGAVDEEERAELLAALFPVRERAATRGETRLVATAFAVTGAMGMICQVLWTRALAIVIGSSVYSFSLILVIYLLGHATGAAILSRRLARVTRPAALLASLVATLALAALLGFALLDHLPGWHLAMMHGKTPTLPLVFGLDAAFVALVVLPPAVVTGAVFPLVVRLIVRRREETGQAVGGVYGANTLGSIVGSLVGGFVLLPFLGLGTSFRVAAAVAVVVAAVLGLAALRMTKPGVPRSRVPLLLGLAGLVVLVGIPDLRPGRLAAGMFRVALAQQIFSRGRFREPRVIYYRDGINATITVEQRDDLLTLKANGKPEASNIYDMPTQIGVGLLPLLFHPKPRRALMVGLASAVSVGSTLAHPELEHFTVVELEEAMLEASRFFWQVNRQPWNDPRVQVVTTDGRNLLEIDDTRYDVIISEPSNPWISGVASLFTVEHFRLVRQRLAPGGVFCQWIQLYELSPENVRSILATFRSVFPHLLVFTSKPKGADLILLASPDRPLSLDLPALERGWQLPGVAEELRRARLQDPADLAGLLFMRSEEVEALAGDAPLNTDDNALIEFSAPLDLVLSNEYEDWFARLSFTEDQQDDPLEALDSLLHESPNAREWNARVLRGLVRGGRLGHATQLAARLIDAGPLHPVALEAVLVLGLLEQKELDVVVQPKASSSAAYRELAVLVAHGFWDDALVAFRKLPDREAETLDGRLLLGYLCHQAGKHEEAVELLTPLVEEDGFPERRPLLLFILGKAHASVADFQEAYEDLAHCARVLKLLQPSSSGDSPFPRSVDLGPAL